MSRLDESAEFALSIKQPWATLVLLGLKTIEVRRWSTPIRGRIHLHAGKLTDERPEGWSRVPEEHFGLTARRGGVVGAVELVECLTYRSIRDFTRHCQLHFNDPSWFRPPRLYGFRFENPKIVPFRAFPGQVKFFSVAPPTKRATSAPISSESLEAARSKIARKKLVQFELDPKRNSSRPRTR
jgi:hypothetical protein